MYKVKLNCLSLTWVWLKFNFQLKTNPGANVQIQTQFFEIDLSLTNSVFNEKPVQERMYKVKLNFLSLTWVWLIFKFQLKTNAGAHVQCQTQLFEFDLSLTRIQFSAKNPSQNTCTKSNSIFSSCIWAYKKYYSKGSPKTHTDRGKKALIEHSDDKPENPRQRQTKTQAQ